MTPRRGLVLDANILILGALGKRVPLAAGDWRKPTAVCRTLKL